MARRTGHEACRLFIKPCGTPPLNNQTITMKIRAIILASALLGMGSLAAATPNVRPSIVGGTESTPGSRPIVVSLHKNGSHYCGGTLINKDWVVTAAHCFSSTSTSPWTVVIGRQDLTTSAGEAITVSQIIKHPSYNSSTSDNDITLLKLSRSATAVSRFAALPTVDQMNTNGAPGQNVTTMGWGALTEGGSSPTRLREVTVPVVSNATCNAAASYNGTITGNMICAGLAAGGKDSCQGDSGGPLIFNAGGTDVLAGVVSFGDGCARPNKYGVYTRVVNYVGWINGYVGATTPSLPKVAEVESNNTQATAQVISAASEVNGTMSASTDKDFFAITLPAGKTLSAVLTPGQSTQDVDLYVYSASGTQLAKSENGAGATDSASTKNSGTAAVKVIVEVRYYSGGTGATNGKYSLKLSY